MPSENLIDLRCDLGSRLPPSCCFIRILFLATCLIATVNKQIPRRRTNKQCNTEQVVFVYVYVTSSQYHVRAMYHILDLRRSSARSLVDSDRTSSADRPPALIADRPAVNKIISDP